MKLSNPIVGPAELPLDVKLPADTQPATPVRSSFLPFALPDIGNKEIQNVVETLRSGWITTGPRTKEFERRFREYVGAPYAIAVNSCTAALHIALAALGIGPYDEVITTSLTFCATANVILHLGATPIFADVDNDFNINPDKIERLITPHTKAIVPVHYAGQPCRMDKILEIARKYSLPVVEDAAHAVGASYRGQIIGSIGDITAFSFYAIKNMTTGEGGMITTDNAELAEKMQLLSLHGMNKDAWKRYSSAGSWYYEVHVPGLQVQHDRRAGRHRPAPVGSPGQIPSRP